MASINELYNRLEEAIPAELSCDWDNDGRMVVPNGEKDVKKALEVAEDFGYSEDIKRSIKACKSQIQLDNVLAGARHNY